MEQESVSRSAVLSRSFLSARPPPTTAGSSITGTHSPPRAQANVSPLDCSNICLMDVFWVEWATWTPDWSQSRWEQHTEETVPLRLEVRYTSIHLHSRAWLLNPTSPPSPFVLPSFPIPQLCVCVHMFAYTAHMCYSQVSTELPGQCLASSSQLYCLHLAWWMASCLISPSACNLKWFPGASRSPQVRLLSLSSTRPLHTQHTLTANRCAELQR